MLARPHGWPAAVAVEKHGLSPVIRGCQSAALGRTRLDAFGARAVSPESRESWERGGARRDRVSPMRPARGSLSARPRTRRGHRKGLRAVSGWSAAFAAFPWRLSLRAFQLGLQLGLQLVLQHWRRLIARCAGAARYVQRRRGGAASALPNQKGRCCASSLLPRECQAVAQRRTRLARDRSIPAQQPRASNLGVRRIRSGGTDDAFRGTCGGLRRALDSLQERADLDEISGRPGDHLEICTSLDLVRAAMSDRPGIP